MNAWLMSIVGIVSISVLLEIILSDGETSKFIKGIFSLAVVLTIILPLPKLLDSDFDMDKIFDSEMYGYDEEFVTNVVLERNVIRQGKCEVILSEKGVEGALVTIVVGNAYDEIKSVSVYVDNEKHINTIEETMSEYLKEPKEVVKVYVRE